MISKLPVNLEDLLRQRKVEGERIEYKAGWNPDAVIRTLCAFANDFANRRYRNRRVGEFLKELDLTEGRSTGISKILRVMSENGSPAPEFETDDDRTYFLIRLPVHERAAAMARARVPVTSQVTGEVTGEVTREVWRLLTALTAEAQRRELQEALGLKHEDHFRKAYLVPALDAGLVEMTLPDKPRSSKQRYRLTEKGRLWLEAHRIPDPAPNEEERP